MVVYLVSIQGKEQSHPRNSTFVDKDGNKGYAYERKNYARCNRRISI